MKNALLISALVLSASFGIAQDSKTGRFHHGNPHGGAPGYQGNYYSPPVMAPDEFARACDAIRRPGFDDDRLAVASQVARGGMLSSAHVATILGLLSFESTRLEFAKYAYHHVVDPYNYYVVNDGFSFSSSISDLNNYLSTVSVGGQVVGTSGSYGSNGGGGNTVTYSTGTMTATGGISGGAPSGNVGVNSYNGGCNMPVAICEADFERIVCTVRNRSFDSDRLLVAKQAVEGRWINSGMVLRIMRLLSFESSRLDFAKFAYRLTVDPQNYYLVNDGFSFSSSSRDLDCYIRAFH
jgi:hypothetical protein